MPIIWERYQKCDVCFAPLGKPCTELSGFVVVGDQAVGIVDPHSTRKLRAGYARTGGRDA